MKELKIEKKKNNKRKWERQKEIVAPTEECLTLLKRYENKFILTCTQHHSIPVFRKGAEPYKLGAMDIFTPYLEYMWEIDDEW